MKPIDPETLKTRKRYDRTARFYDLMESPMEALRFEGWRARLREEITGGKALEAGVGTGKNMPFYPEATWVVGIDISPGMLKRARQRVAGMNKRITLEEMDVQSLEFPDHTFDTVLATFVFCSVPDPVKGLRELRRVCKPDGRLVLLEHMHPGNPLLGFAFDALNPLTARITGANINRRTIRNIQKAGWHIVEEKHLFLDIVRWIKARP